MSMTVVRGLPEDSWRAFVAEHPQGNIFHTPEMFQVFSRTRGYAPAVWAVTQGEQILSFMLPVRISLMGGPLRYLTTRTVVHGGVLCATGPKGRAALSLMLKAYTQAEGNSTLFTTIYETANLPASQPPLYQYGFVYAPSLNYLVDLNRSPEDILQGMQRRTRQKIRRGLKLDEVSIEEVTDRHNLSAIYELVRLSCDYGKHSLADSSLLEATFDILRPKGLAVLTVARVGERLIAASVDLPYKGTIFGWYGGMDRRHAPCAANELLLWNIFEWGAQSGYQIYNFGGAGLPNEQSNIGDFKAKFGAELVYLGHNTCVHAPVLMQLSKIGYSIYRRTLGRRLLPSTPQPSLTVVPPSSATRPIPVGVPAADVRGDLRPVRQGESGAGRTTRSAEPSDGVLL